MNPLIDSPLSELLKSSLPPVVLDAMLKGLILLSLIGLLALCLRKSSAAARHGPWLAGLLGVLALPILGTHLPDWKVLPRAWLPNVDQPTVDAKTAQPDSAAGSTLSNPTAHSIPLEVPITHAKTDPAIAPSAESLSVNIGKPVAPNSPGSGEVLSFGQWIALIWWTGFTLLMARLLISRAGLALLARRAGKVTGGELQSELQDLCSQLGIRRRVVLLLSQQRVIPMTWGIIRPRVMLPTEAVHWTAEKRRTVLLHEMVHVLRRDSLSQLIGQIASAFHWFNPLVWVAVWRLSIEREQACDDRVIGNGINPSDYAELILKMSAALPIPQVSGATATAMAKPFGLEKRLRGILNPQRNRQSPGWGLMLAGSAFLTLIICPLAMIEAADEHQDPKSNSGPGTAPVTTPMTLSPSAYRERPVAATNPMTNTAPSGFSQVEHAGKLFRITSSTAKAPLAPEYPVASEADENDNEDTYGLIRVIPADPGNTEPESDFYRILVGSADGELLSFAVDEGGGTVLVSDVDDGNREILLVKDERRSNNRKLMIQRLDKLRTHLVSPTQGHEHMIELRLNLQAIDESGNPITLGGLLVDDTSDQAGLEKLYGEIAQQLAQMLQRLEQAMGSADDVDGGGGSMGDMRALELQALDRKKFLTNRPQTAEIPEPASPPATNSSPRQTAPGATGLGAPTLGQLSHLVEPMAETTPIADPNSGIDPAPQTSPGGIETAPAGMFGQSQMRRVSNADLYKLALPVSGIVSEAPVEVGTRVKKGQLLLQLDDRRAINDLAIAKQQLDVAKATFELRATEYEMEKTQSDILKKLHESGRSSPAELGRIQRETIASKAAMKVSQAEIAVATSQLNQAELTVQQHQIIAPVDGIITSVDQKQGEYASTGIPSVILRASPPADGAGAGSGSGAANEVPKPIRAASDFGGRSNKIGPTPPGLDSTPTVDD